MRIWFDVDHRSTGESNFDLILGECPVHSLASERAFVLSGFPSGVGR